MKFWRTLRAPTLILGWAVLTASHGAAAQSIVKMDGSSTVFPIAEAVAEEFQLEQRGKVRITVGIAGTGGGFKRFCRGEADIANASRPISQGEMEACRKAGIKYIELPVAFDALTVVVNPQNTWVKALSPAELKKIWEPAAQGRITRWNQVRADYPDEPLMLFGPGADSGTFDYFTEAVNGKSKASRTDFQASEDDNVIVQGVSTNKGAIGYFGYAYYVGNKERVRAVPIQNRRGELVAPSLETVIDGSYEPLSRPLFIYVSQRSAQRPEVKAFIRFFLTEGGELAQEVGYVPLSQKAYRLALEHFEAAKLGTVYGGVLEVGVTIEDLLVREGKL